MVEYKGFANCIDGPLWCSLTVHKDHMLELMDKVRELVVSSYNNILNLKVEENEFQQSLKYHYKVKISRNT